MKNLKLILIVFIAGALSMTLQAKKVSLKYTLEKGSEVSYLLTQTQEIEQDMMGQMQTMTSDVKSYVNLMVKDVTPEGNYLMQKSLSRFIVTSGSQMGDVEFDSDDTDQTSPYAKTVKLLIDNPIVFVMNPNGLIIEIKDVDKFADEFAGILEGSSPEMQMLAGLAGQFASEDGIRQSVGVMLFAYPAEKIKTGKAWETKSQTKQMINFNNTASTMVNEVKGDVATLTQEATIEVGDGDNKMEMQGMQMEYQMSGNKKGSYEVDTKTGLMIKGTGITTISGVISVDSPQLPAPMSIPMTIKSTDTIERL